MRGKHARRAALRREREATAAADQAAQEQAVLHARLASALGREAAASAAVIDCFDVLDAAAHLDEPRVEAVEAAAQAQAEVKRLRTALQSVARAVAYQMRAWQNREPGASGVLCDEPGLEAVLRLMEEGINHMGRQMDKPRNGRPKAGAA